MEAFINKLQEKKPGTIFVPPTTYHMIKRRQVEGTPKSHAYINSIERFRAMNVTTRRALAKIHDHIGHEIEGDDGVVYVIVYTTTGNRKFGHYFLVTLKYSKDSLSADVYDTVEGGQKPLDLTVINELLTYIQWKTGSKGQINEPSGHPINFQKSDYECGVLVMVHLYAAITGKSQYDVKADAEFVEKARKVIAGVLEEGKPLETMDSLLL